MGASQAIARGFQYGLLIFALTALLGLANATKIWGDLSRDQLLTHLHAGTLGWITIGVFAIAAWIFGAASPSLGRYLAGSAVVTAAYVIAFWTGNFPARAIFGAIELVVIYAWWGWAARRALSEGLGRISVPKLSVALGLTTLVVGSTLGVIVQAQLALSQASQQTGNLISAHAGAQVGGYLVLVAAGIVEWQLLGERPPSRAGQLQAALLFLSGIALSVGLLLNVSPLLLVQIVCQVAGIAIVVGFLILGAALTVDLVVQFIRTQDPTSIPAGLFTALSHTMFVGVMTNALFGAIYLLTRDRPRAWAWADQLIFWGLNLGAAAFIVVLLAVGSSAGAGPFAHPVAYTAPIMGLAALLGIATFLQRLQPARAARRVPAPA
ncbi:MAG TPA: hypothetical protein VFA01_09395 [Candidatus Dormibacteraeota bacterium]|nr:hypothetical protein [Candidatus Dormibacteraeota bacterium]